MRIQKSDIPNYLTAARAVAVPIALGVMVGNGSVAVLFWIFALASLTDFLDGYLARKWNCVSAFGALVDPVADKLLVILMLLYLLQQHHLPLVPTTIIILREIYVSALRDFISARGGMIPVSKGGKWKTALQMLSIAGLLAALMLASSPLWNLGIVLIWIAAGLALTSAITYSRVALPMLRRNS